LADELTGKQRRHLRALGHHLTPVVQVGHEGISEAVVRQTDRQLEVHELIKVRIGETAPEDRHRTAGALAEKTRAVVAQVLGRTALLYRPRGEKPGIVLPK
jgi:RNA-binding protein